MQIDEKLAQLREASGGEILDDLRKLQARLLKLKENKSELRGAMASEEKQASDIISSLTSERYRNIDQRHTNALIDVKTHSLANADLDVYYRALDKALMAFHSIKMKEINETLKEYWQSVYKGADIDEIKIVSDGAIIGKKRNYNYRVVMKQGDTELDMRGRCSAGQKVLASLLIRLALADTFCSQCAVLALDEPVRTHERHTPNSGRGRTAPAHCRFSAVSCAFQTTNLDQKNITAFAQALNQIIQKRSVNGRRIARPLSLLRWLLRCSRSSFRLLVCSVANRATSNSSSSHTTRPSLTRLASALKPSTTIEVRTIAGCKGEIAWSADADSLLVLRCVFLAPVYKDQAQHSKIRKQAIIPDEPMREERHV